MFTGFKNENKTKNENKKMPSFYTPVSEAEYNVS